LTVKGARRLPQSRDPSTDRTGSYLPAIVVIEVMMLLAAVGISRLRPPAWRHAARPG
jgi:hypothetical protein